MSKSSRRFVIADCGLPATAGELLADWVCISVAL